MYFSVFFLCLQFISWSWANIIFPNSILTPWFYTLFSIDDWASWQPHLSLSIWRQIPFETNVSHPTPRVAEEGWASAAVCCGNIHHAAITQKIHTADDECAWWVLLFRSWKRSNFTQQHACPFHLSTADIQQQYTMFVNISWTMKSDWLTGLSS